MVSEGTGGVSLYVEPHLDDSRSTDESARVVDLFADNRIRFDAGAPRAIPSSGPEDSEDEATMPPTAPGRWSTG